MDKLSSFEFAVRFVLSNEGGLSENPNDTGGITNHGVSLRFLRELPSENLKRLGIFYLVTEQTIRDLTIDQAILIYKYEFWEKEKFDQIICNIAAAYIFDMAINHGISKGIKLVQRSLWAANPDLSRKLLLKDDGVLGEDTLYRINEFCNDNCVLIGALRATRAGFYRLLVEKNPKDREFLNGWLERCYKL